MFGLTAAQPDLAKLSMPALMKQRAVMAQQN